MLSDAEREALVGIELDLWQEDPKLVAALSQHRIRSWSCLAHDVVIGFSALTGLGCLTLSEVGGVEGGCTALAFAVTTFGVRMWRFAPR